MARALQGILGWLGIMTLIFVLGDTLSGHASLADVIMAACGVGVLAAMLFVWRA